MAGYARTSKMVLEYQETIPHSPITVKQLYADACASDEITISTWAEQWLAQTKANKEKYGSFKANSLGTLYGKYRHSACIIAGSGTSLENNIEILKNNRKTVPLISCLHNFSYFADNGIVADYYVTLDAGAVTISEISEGGKKTHDEYLEATKGSTLLAFIGTHPDLLKAWRGKVLFFNAPIPDKPLADKIQEVENFGVFVSNGGNVLGACLYIAKAIFGCNPIAFVGADFCFSYDNRFHPQPSQYDGKLGGYLKVTDVFGNMVRTWQSYNNFKKWFDYIAQTVPGIYINCSEGGTFGAYYNGNIQDVIQMPLVKFLEGFTLFEHIRSQCENPESNERILLFQEIKLAYTATLINESVFGNKRVRAFLVAADAAAGTIATGLNTVDMVSVSFKSCTTAGFAVLRNKSTTATVSNGSIAFASAASSDTFEIICFGG